jgi:hypothetical protein
LNIRDCSTAVTVINKWIMADSSMLRMILEDNAWESVINLDPAVVPQLNGILELAFAEGTDWRSLIGTEFKLFNWNGQLGAGSQFASISSSGGAVWDTSRLYTEGVVTLIPEPATVVVMMAGGALLLGTRRRS